MRFDSLRITGTAEPFAARTDVVLFFATAVLFAVVFLRAALFAFPRERAVVFEALLFEAVFDGRRAALPRALALFEEAREVFFARPLGAARPRLPPLAFLFFGAISNLLSDWLPTTADHTISFLSTRTSSRVAITPQPGGLRVEIRPLVRTRSARVRLLTLALLVLGAAFFGAARLGQAWETGLKKGEFSDLPLPLLAGLSVAVGVSTPAALGGLAALAFAEESIEVAPDAVTVRSTAFERTRILRVRREEIECWRETYLPLSPWWTWAVRRLAIASNGRLHPLCGAAGPKEKRMIALALARATGKPLLDVLGRQVKLD